MQWTREYEYKQILKKSNTLAPYTKKYALLYLIISGLKRHTYYLFVVIHFNSVTNSFFYTWMDVIQDSDLIFVFRFHKNF